jgi:sulfur relay (sulfurtransferase) DsrF/TusC family protein
MKFRKLDKEELQEMEPEFIRFLAANTITGDDWEKLKVENLEKAEGLIEIFSDIVFEKILKKIEYLEIKTPNDLRTFHCEAEKIKMIGLKINGESSVDFTKNQDPTQIMSLLRLSNAKLQLYKGEKSYAKEREVELFELMEQQGALISKDGHLYKTLAQLQ